MGDLHNLFLVSPTGPQEESVGHFCFDVCQKILIGAVRVPMGGNLFFTGAPCDEEVCPYEAARFDFGTGELNGEQRQIFARKLKEVPKEAPDGK